MENLIKRLFQKSVELNDYEYSEYEIKSNWIGNKPTSLNKIQKKESELSVKFPDDYKELLLICNEFKTCCDAV